MCLLVSHMPVSCSLSCDPVPHFLGCLCALVHGLGAMVRSQSGAFHPLWQGRPAIGGGRHRAAGHWLPPLRNHGSGGSVPALGGGSGIFASGVSGSQARLMLLAFFGDQLLEEGDGGLRRKKKSLPKGRYQRVLETRRLLQRGCEGVGGCGGAMPYLCLSLSHRCHCPVACVSSLLSP